MISLLIPTLNRSEFVVRLLRYYKYVDFQGDILVGDSSDIPHANRIQTEIPELQGSLPVNYFSKTMVLGRSTIRQRASKIIQKIPTLKAGWESMRVL